MRLNIGGGAFIDILFPDRDVSTWAPNDGSLVARLKDNKENEIIILTGDSDTLQLTSTNVKVFTMKKGISDLVVYDAVAAEEKLGFAPELLPDYKALAGS